MSSHAPNIWDTVMNNFFDDAILATTQDKCTGNTYLDLDPGLNRLLTDREAIRDSILSNDIEVSDLPPTDVTPPLGTPNLDHANYMDGQMQMIWSAEVQDFVQLRLVMSEQHHEKSCSRCSLNETEARKCRLDRRRGQNRESQRKFRARKEAKIREATGQVAALETYVDFLEQHNNELEELNTQLQQKIAELVNGRYLCTTLPDTSEPYGIDMDALESWRSRQTINSSTSAQEHKLVKVAAPHHRSSCHEILPPSGLQMSVR